MSHPRTGYAFGKNKGHITTPINIERVVAKKSFKPTEKLSLARSVADEICGLAPYEKKAIDMLRKGNDKRCKKFLKLRLGDMKRTKKKLAKLGEKLIE